MKKLLRWFCRKLIKWRYMRDHRRFCKANGYFCPDCIYHEHIFEGITFRGTRCLYFQKWIERGGRP